MLLPLVGVGFAAVPASWLALPVAADLHPVGWNYGVRYQEVVCQTVGGPDASPVFSPVVTMADLHWRFLASTGEGLRLQDSAAGDWRDAAVAAALLTTGRIADETAARSATIDVFYTAFDTVLHPSLHVSRRADGALTVVHRPGGQTAQRVARAEADLELPPLRARPPTADVGLAWHLRDAQDPPDTPFLDYGAYVALSGLALSNLRLDLLARAGDWSVTGREQVLPRVFVVGTARSSNADFPRNAPWTTRAALGRWSAGLLWNLPHVRGWTTRLDRIVTLADGDVTWQITLRGEFGAPAPGSPTPALGARDPNDPSLPTVPERSANTIVPVSVSPVGETAPKPTARSGGRRSPGRR